jgi:hypothetical protein
MAWPHPNQILRRGLRSCSGNALLRKMTPDPLPLLIRESESSDIYSGSTPARNFEIGSSQKASYRELLGRLFASAQRCGGLCFF